MQQTNALDTATTAALVWVLSVLPGVNGDALIGAFAGAAVFALSSTDPRLWRKLTYMVLSFVLGYALGPEVVDLLPFRSVTAGAFAVSALVVTFTVTVIERIRSLDIGELIARLRKGG